MAIGILKKPKHFGSYAPLIAWDSPKEEERGREERKGTREVIEFCGIQLDRRKKRRKKRDKKKRKNSKKKGNQF